MLAAAYGTVSDIEMVWILSTLIGAIYAGLNTRAANANSRALKKLGISNGRLTLAVLFRAAAAMRLSVQLIFLSIGISAAFFPEPVFDQQPLKIVVAGALVRWGLIAASVILTVREIMETSIRKRLLGG